MEQYLIDIDGTVSEDIPNEEAERFPNAKVMPGAVEKINAAYDRGHLIFFWTSRTHLHREVTLAWLRAHGFKFHGLITDKPRGGNWHWIDNLKGRFTLFQGKWADINL